MKTHNPLVLIALTIITFGIYGLFWLAETSRDMRKRGIKNLPPVWWAFGPVILLLGTALLQFVIRFLLGQFSDDMSTPTGQDNGLLLAINLLSLLFGFVALFVAIPTALYWFFRYCEAADMVTKGGLPLALSLVLLVVLGAVGLPFIWPGYMQAGFNKVK